MNINDVLIVVDYQNDFVTGSLAVPNAENLVVNINKLINNFKNVFATQDWHPSNHFSFKRNGGIWPDHCIATSWGADFPIILNSAKIKSVFRKGFDSQIESYSAIQDEKNNLNPLSLYLESGAFNDSKIFVCGLATDYCVKSTALDCANLVYLDTWIVSDAVASVDPNFDINSIGIETITTEELLNGT